MTTGVSRALVQAAILIAWIIPAPTFLRGSSEAESEATHRDSASRFGIFIQGIAFGCSFLGPWWLFGPRSPMMHPAIGIGTVLLAFAGSFLVIRSVRALGRQWSLTARIAEGHRLITSGPYAHVRNPIYTGMFALQVATCLAFSAGRFGYSTVPLTAAIYLVGTMMRIRSEERLLRANFGSEFDAYARRVPALIPLPTRSTDKRSAAGDR